ncbi:MAG: hypothetical protein AAF829_13770 [Pseudomonadota bacterium]
MAAWVVFAGYGVSLTVLALKPSSGSLGFAGQDKLMHAGAFALLFSLGWVALRGVYLLRLVLGCLGLGLSIEVAQGLMPFGREPSLGDLVANAIGVAAAWGLALLAQKYLGA